MHTTERRLFTFNCFAVSAFIYFATAVGADVEAGFDSYGDEFCEALEKTRAEFPAFSGEFEDFSLFLAHGLDGVSHQAFFFELLEEGVDEAWADFFFDAFFEAADYLVAVGWSFV